MDTKKFVGRKASPSNTIIWKPDDGTLPMIHIKKGNRFGGVAALLIGIPWLYSSARYLAQEVLKSGLQGGQAFLFLLVLGGLFVVLCGISQFMYMEETEIKSDMVSRRRRGLGGFSAWSEPLLAYRGVLKKSIPWEGEHGRSCIVYSLILSHEDSAKQVLLYQTESTLMEPPSEWEKQWNAYAALFRLPLL